MTNNSGTHRADVLIVGGGLAGLVAAKQISRGSRRKVILVDSPLREADGSLGGFARFSGAKFSLPPAGLGLVPIVGTRAKLDRVCDDVLNLLGLHGLRRVVSSDVSAPPDNSPRAGRLNLRQYESIVLTPGEMTALVLRLEASLDAQVTTIRGACTSISQEGGGWTVKVLTDSDEITVAASIVVVAGGRASGLDLSALGAVPTMGKGIDVGLRVEFIGDGLDKLRNIGPDAKLIMGSCRTFCLNVPGKIFGHSFRGVLIPGGVVADAGTQTSNVGILCRLDVDKAEWLESFFSRISMIDYDLSVPLSSIGSSFSELKGLLEQLYGNDTADQLLRFLRLLGSEGFVDWDREHRFYLPLLDWYWSTFAESETFETSVPSLYVIGDQSGHARGLLQAAVSGWLLAEQLDG